MSEPEGLLHRLDALDVGLYRRAAQRNSRVLDAVLPRLTRSADHGLLWGAVAVALAASGTRTGRRAALRGSLALGLASAFTNIPAKLLTRRPRPDLQPVPVVRRLTRQPLTTSFPSGHSASAAAFALGVSLEAPVLALPVGALAAGVAYGRVHTGVHYPGDVAAGIAVGCAAALTVRRAWPVPAPRPDVEQRPAQAPALEHGEGLVVVVNRQSGSSGRMQAEIQEHLPAAEVVAVDGEDVPDALERAARSGRVLGVAGGDGTVGTAAAAALAAGVPLAVLPGGTLNHFAAELGVSSVADVAAAIEQGCAVAVDLGRVLPDSDDVVFVNTFAIGVYPELVRERELHERRFGKWPALLVATVRLLRRARPVQLEVDGEERRLWTLFVGNGHYHPAGFAPSWRDRLDDGTVDVRLVDATAPGARTRLALAVLTGRLGRSTTYEQRVVAELPVRPLQEGLTIALDGEVRPAPPEMLLRSTGERLVVYRPARA